MLMWSLTNTPTCWSERSGRGWNQMPGVLAAFWNTALVLIEILKLDVAWVPLRDGYLQAGNPYPY